MMLGDLATWVTGIVTAGSLWLGFLILRADRRREIRAQASTIMLWDFLLVTHNGSNHEIRLVNNSDQPIMQARAILEIGGQIQERQFFVMNKEVHDADYGLIFPGDQCGVTFHEMPADFNGQAARVAFTDGLDRSWLFDLRSRTLTRERSKATTLMRIKG